MGRKSNAAKYNESVCQINEAVRRLKEFREELRHFIQELEKEKQGEKDPLEIEIINQQIRSLWASIEEREATLTCRMLQQVQHQRDDLHMPELAEAWEALGTRVFIEDAIMPGLAEADQK